MALVPSARDGRGRKPELLLGSLILPPSLPLLQNDLDSIGTEFKQSDYSFYVQLLRAGENHHTFYNYYEDDNGYYYSERKKARRSFQFWKNWGRRQKACQTKDAGENNQSSLEGRKRCAAVLLEKWKDCIARYNWCNPFPVRVGFWYRQAHPQQFWGRPCGISWPFP